MMTLTDIWLMAVALAMDCTTVSMVAAISRPRTAMTSWTVMRMALLFGLFQALMPFLGWMGVSFVAASLEHIGRWVAFFLLLFVGGRMVVETLQEQHLQPTATDVNRLSVVLLLAVATSIDALAVGISMAVTGYRHAAQLGLPLLIIGLMSTVLSLCGYAVGKFLSGFIPHWLKPGLLGGVILIAIAFKTILAEAG